MSHRLTEREITDRAENYRLIRPPVPEYWHLKLNDYEIPRETVSLKIIPSLRIDEGQMMDGPIVQFLDVKGTPCGTIDNAFPCPPFCP